MAEALARDVVGDPLGAGWAELGAALDGFAARVGARHRGFGAAREVGGSPLGERVASRWSMPTVLDGGIDVFGGAELAAVGREWGAHSGYGDEFDARGDAPLVYPVDPVAHVTGLRSHQVGRGAARRAMRPVPARRRPAVRPAPRERWRPVAGEGGKRLSPYPAALGSAGAIEADLLRFPDARAEVVEGARRAVVADPGPARDWSPAGGLAPVADAAEATAERILSRAAPPALGAPAAEVDLWLAPERSAPAALARAERATRTRAPREIHGGPDAPLVPVLAAPSRSGEPRRRGEPPAARPVEPPAGATAPVPRAAAAALEAAEAGPRDRPAALSPRSGVGTRATPAESRAVSGVAAVGRPASPATPGAAAPARGPAFAVSADPVGSLVRPATPLAGSSEAGRAVRSLARPPAPGRVPPALPRTRPQVPASNRPGPARAPSTPGRSVARGPVPPLVAPVLPREASPAETQGARSPVGTAPALVPRGAGSAVASQPWGQSPTAAAPTAGAPAPAVAPSAPWTPGRLAAPVGVRAAEAVRIAATRWLVARGVTPRLAAALARRAETGGAEARQIPFAEPGALVRPAPLRPPAAVAAAATPPLRGQRAFDPRTLASPGAWQTRPEVAPLTGPEGMTIAAGDPRLLSAEPAAPLDTPATPPAAARPDGAPGALVRPSADARPWSAAAVAPAPPRVAPSRPVSLAERVAEQLGRLVSAVRPPLASGGAPTTAPIARRRVPGTGRARPGPGAPSPEPVAETFLRLGNAQRTGRPLPGAVVLPWSPRLSGASQASPEAGASGPFAPRVAAPPARIGAAAPGAPWSDAGRAAGAPGELPLLAAVAQRAGAAPMAALGAAQGVQPGPIPGVTAPVGPPRQLEPGEQGALVLPWQSEAPPTGAAAAQGTALRPMATHAQAPITRQVRPIAGGAGWVPATVEAALLPVTPREAPVGALPGAPGAPAPQGARRGGGPGALGREAERLGSLVEQRTAEAPPASTRPSSDGRAEAALAAVEREVGDVVRAASARSVSTPSTAAGTPAAPDFADAVLVQPVAPSASPAGPGRLEPANVARALAAARSAGALPPSGGDPAAAAVAALVETGRLEARAAQARPAPTTGGQLFGDRGPHAISAPTERGGRLLVETGGRPASEQALRSSPGQRPSRKAETGEEARHRLASQIDGSLSPEEVDRVARDVIDQLTRWMEFDAARIGEDEWD